MDGGGAACRRIARRARGGNERRPKLAESSISGAKERRRVERERKKRRLKGSSGFRQAGSRAIRRRKSVRMGTCAEQKWILTLAAPKQMRDKTGARGGGFYNGANNRGQRARARKCGAKKRSLKGGVWGAGRANCLPGLPLSPKGLGAIRYEYSAQGGTSARGQWPRKTVGSGNAAP